MATRVTDFSLSLMRITPADHAALPEAARRLLAVYAARSWAEDGMLVFEVGSYRVAEICAAVQKS